MSKEQDNNSPILAMLKASSEVRKGSWIDGAPTHIFAELLTALENDNWHLIKIHPDHPSHTSKQLLRDTNEDDS